MGVWYWSKEKTDQHVLNFKIRSGLQLDMVYNIMMGPIQNFNMNYVQEIRISLFNDTMKSKTFQNRR